MVLLLPGVASGFGNASKAIKPYSPNTDPDALEKHRAEYYKYLQVRNTVSWQIEIP